MGALPQPHLAPGPHRELVDALHTLHHRAGWPSLRRLAAETGVSHTTVSKALSSPALPRWGTLELLVEVMGGDVARFHELWLAASAPAEEQDQSSVAIAGRSAELTVVRRHLDAGSGLLLLTGEAGIGKTTLVRAAAARTDATVVAGHCLHLSREVPLLPFIDALRTLHETDGGRWMKEVLAECPVYVRQSLQRLLPELGRDTVAATDDPWGLERLLSSVGSVLRKLAATRPLALHLEDCQWADRNTLDLLTHLASTPGTVPVVATWRTGDSEVPTDHSDWLATARWTAGVRTVDLEPLTFEETAEQLRLLRGSAAPPAETERIHARSQGLPLYTAQLADATDNGGLPQQLADLLDRRIGDLDAGAWTVARLLGMAQRRMGPRLLRDASGLAPEAIEDGLRVLANRGLIRTGTGDDAELSHPLFVDAVQRRLLPGEGARVHAQLARALTDEPGIEPAEVADHWRAAGHPSQEAPHRVAAARRADERFAQRQALNAWLRVLDLWDAGEHVDGTELFDVLVRALDAAGQVFDVDARRVLARRAGRLDLPDHQRAVALQWMAVSLAGDGLNEQALALLDEALGLLERQPPSPELEELLATRVHHFMQVGRINDAHVELRRGLGVREALGQTRSRNWTAQSAWVTMWSGDLDGAMTIARDALTSEWPEFDPVGDMQLACTATAVMLHAACPAREIEETARDTLREIGAYDLTHSNGGVVLRGNISSAYLSQGEVAVAREWVRPVTRSAPRDPDTATVHVLLGAIELREGQVQSAVDRCRAAATQMRAHDQNWAESVPWHAEVELWAGNYGPAIELLDEALAVTLQTQTFDTAAALRLDARAHADRLETDGAPRAERSRVAMRLEAAMADARTDPFGRAQTDVSVPACLRSWRAELSRIQGTAKVEAWVSAAADWDRLVRPHDAAYCRWRGAQVALQEGQGTLASRILKRAETDARTHVPLARAIAATARGG